MVAFLQLCRPSVICHGVRHMLGVYLFFYSQLFFAIVMWAIVQDLIAFGCYGQRSGGPQP